MFEFSYMETYLFPSFVIVMLFLVAGIGALVVKGGK
jgi:hypothetical protein